MDLHSNTEFIVAIDFGSTFTKVRYILPTIQAVAGDESVVWPCYFDGHAGTECIPYVPSIIQYNTSGNVVGWGFNPIVEGAVEIKGIKLCIQHEDERMIDPTTYPVTADSIQRRNALGKTVLTVLTDFMTRLWQVCKPQIPNHEPGVSWRLIITHPVGWNIEKLEQAIDVAIVTPDQDNSAYTICFQTESEAALIAELADQGIQLAHDGNRQPQGSRHHPTGQETHIQDSEVVVVADLGGLTMDIASTRVSTQTGIMSAVPQVVPTSGLYGASILSDAFMNLLQEKAGMLLRTPPSSEWFHRALRRWEQDIFPALTGGMITDVSFDMAPEAFKNGARITHYRWAKDGKFPIYSMELHSIMDFYMDKAIADIGKQIEELRAAGYPANYLCLTGGFGQNSCVRRCVDRFATTCGLRFNADETIVSGMMAVSHGAALYGRYLSLANRSLGPAGQNSDISIFIGHDRIILVRKGELMPPHTFKRIPIKGYLMQSCFQRNTGSYTLDVYSAGVEGPFVSNAYIIWRPFQRVKSDAVCVLEIRMHDENHHGTLKSFVQSAYVAIFVNGVKQGRAYLAHR
ncbi:hypothetical protein HD806DRAFT_552088 [Xylariaceae sp. AK1471]|nr:hypothetical protein HD806DRAFT_552088 [Xylariaceae sp. AK1471]